ncbi:MAG: hypothetical protein FWH57_04430 [Oscillospiraceae bacterium]|nr:hypothetical protein [Oscillospiraceae bacterium]
MALGEINLFSWKSKDKRQKDQEEYAVWAFPYGQKQRGNLEGLLRDLLPKESTSISLVAYLTCKELYEGAVKSADTDASDGNATAIGIVMKDQKRYRQIIKSKDMPTYIALVMADANIDEQCVYPTADEIRASAQELSERHLR